MKYKDYYKILGLETSRVSIEEIKTAYRTSAKKYHPDLNVGDSLAEERIKDINEAYRVLSNPSSKRKYDRIWNRNIGNKQNQKGSEENRSIDSVFSDFFSMFFGSPNNNEEKEENKTKKKIPVKGENIETEINVGIEDAYYGTEKKISLRTVER